MSPPSVGREVPPRDPTTRREAEERIQGACPPDVRIPYSTESEVHVERGGPSPCREKELHQLPFIRWGGSFSGMRDSLLFPCSFLYIRVHFLKSYFFLLRFLFSLA